MSRPLRPEPRAPRGAFGDERLRRALAFFAIVGLSTFAAVVYGTLQDQITARMSVEYFTIGHGDFLGTDDPTLLGFFWGFVATWWVGVILGGLLGAASQFGRWPRIGARALVRPVLLLLLVTAVVAALAGVVGNVLSKLGVVWLLEPLATSVPADRHVAFLTCMWTHSAAYGAAGLGGLVLSVWTLVRRGRLAVEQARGESDRGHPQL